MSFFKELYDKEIQRPSKDIAIINNNEISQKSEIFIIEKNKKLISRYDLVIKSSYYNKKCYKVQNGYIKHSMCTMDGKSVLNISEDADKNVKRKVYLGKNNDKLISTIYYDDVSDKKYKIEFTNLISGDTEYFEMCNDRMYVVCDIFYGKEEDGLLIGKIIRDPKNIKKCVLEVAPGVDSVFLIGLAALFYDTRFFKNRKIRNNSVNISKSNAKNNNNNDKDLSHYIEYGYNCFIECPLSVYEEHNEGHQRGHDDCDNHHGGHHGDHHGGHHGGHHGDHYGGHHGDHYRGSDGGCDGGWGDFGGGDFGGGDCGGD